MTNLGALLVSRGQIEEAEDWYRRGADAGSPESMNNLGALVEGRDAAAAEEWYRRAAGAGQPAAMTNLAGVLAGRGEVKEAAAWYRQAAAAGEPHAVHALAAQRQPRPQIPPPEGSTVPAGGPHEAATHGGAGAVRPGARLLSTSYMAGPQYRWSGV
jgi:uncharacterized glyoxalase superfamily protein PhnB